MLMQAYVSATGAALVVALGLNAMVKVSFENFVLQLLTLLWWRSQSCRN